MNINYKQRLEDLKLQREHILINNKDDENFEDQLNHVEKQISDLEEILAMEKVEEEQSQKPIDKIYSYSGSAWDYHDNEIRLHKIYKTTAKSIRQAINNIKFRIKRDFGYDAKDFIAIDESLIKEE